MGTAVLGIFGLWDRTDDDERREGGVSAQAHGIDASRGEARGVRAHARGKGQAPAWVQRTARGESGGWRRGLREIS